MFLDAITTDNDRCNLLACLVAVSIEAIFVFIDSFKMSRLIMIFDLSLRLGAGQGASVGWDGFSHRWEVRSRLRSRGRHNQGMIRRLTGPFFG